MVEIFKKIDRRVFFIKKVLISAFFLLCVTKLYGFWPVSVTFLAFVHTKKILESPKTNTSLTIILVRLVQKISKVDRSVYAWTLFSWRHPRRFPSYSYYCVVSDQVLRACFHHNIGLLCTDNAYSLVQHGKVYVVGCLIMQFFMFSFWLVAELSSPRLYP